MTNSTQHTTPRVVIPLAQGCEELEAITVIDLMRRAGIEVITVGLDKQPVKASRGTVIIPDTVIDTVLDKDLDMLVLPGGLPGADNLNNDPRIHQLIEKLNQEQKYLAAICAAPRVFATAGLLNNRKATSFPGALDNSPTDNMDYKTDAVVKDGNVVTSRGPGTAMDFALSLIELLMGKAKRDEVEGPLQRPAA